MSRSNDVSMGLFLVILPFACTGCPPEIRCLSTYKAAPSSQVTIAGEYFGSSPGYVVLSGLQITIPPLDWSDNMIRFAVPEEGATGPVYVRTYGNKKSNSVGPFTVERPLGAYEPTATLALAETGLQGAATLVETDGAFLYAVAGCDTLITYDLGNFPPLAPPTYNYDQDYGVKSRIYFPQRLADLKVSEGHLFCVGDFGLRVYNCRDLHTHAAPPITAAVANGAFYAVDIQHKVEPINGFLVALSEYRPRGGSTSLRVLLYEFLPDKGEMAARGEYSHDECEGYPSCTRARQFGIAIDPDYPKIYLAGSRKNWYELAPRGHLDEVSIVGPKPNLTRSQEYGQDWIPWNLETGHNRLWVGFLQLASTGDVAFQAHETREAAGFSRTITIHTNHGPPRNARLTIVDDAVTAAVDGNDNHVFGDPQFPFNVIAMDTEAPCMDDDCFFYEADANTDESYDWALDVTGFTGTGNEGKIFVADEWTGVLTFPFAKGPPLSLSSFLSDYHIPTGGWGGQVHLAQERVYITGHGAPWSASRTDVSDASRWRTVPWNWQAEPPDRPQPNPVSDLCTRRYSDGTYLVGRGHEKAFAWGAVIYGTLYKENDQGLIELLDVADDPINPPYRNTGNSDVLWPEADLAYMTTAADGIRAFIVDPEAPSIALHRKSVPAGLVEKSSTYDRAVCMRWYSDGGSPGRFVVGFDKGQWPLDRGVGGLHLYDVSYPDGAPPDRVHPGWGIEFPARAKKVLSALDGKNVHCLDITERGLIAVSTNEGVAIFSIDAFDRQPAWDGIRVDTSHWGEAVGPAVSDGGFGGLSFDRQNPQLLYVLNDGLWCLDAADPSYPMAYYPATTGYNASNDYEGDGLTAWGNPDVFTLHQPSSVAADGGSIYVTGWPGKVQRLRLDVAGKLE